MNRIIIFSIIYILSFNFLSAQTTQGDPIEKPKFYIGYDLGEMAFNEFKNFAGEIGVKFNNKHTLRFVYLNILLTEAHLSSDFANAVDGDNVTGHWKGYELVYDVPVFKFKNNKSLIYGGLTSGFHDNSYQHTILDESVEHKSATVGFDIGYRETGIFKIEGLYINFQIPFRYKFNPLEETMLGDARVNRSVFGNTISFFIGYEF